MSTLSRRPAAALLIALLYLGACSQNSPSQPETVIETPGGETPSPTAPAAPGQLKATPSTSGIALDWADNSEADLAGYQVSRAAQASGPFTPLTPELLTTSAYTDASAPAGTTSYYQVIAKNKTDQASAAATISALRPAPLVTPPLSSAYFYNSIADQAYQMSESQGRMLGGKLYTFGGFDALKSCCAPTNRAYVYDPASNKWTALTAMPAFGATHAGLAEDGQYLYYAGGYIANTAGTSQIFGTKEVWRYNPQANTYTRMPDLPIERAAGQLEYLGGKLHYFGGTNIARTQDTGEHYVLDLAQNATSWTVAAPLPNPRNHLGSAVLNGKIYAVGGQHGHDDKLVTQATLNVYDPASDTWTALRDLPSPRGHIANSTFVMGGRLIVAGGEASHTHAIGNVDAYDPATNTWTALTPLPSARFSGVAAAYGDGFIYTGGSGTRGGWLTKPMP
ncbi:Kelch repeat-containing protein [Deinococcus sp.]|uniref:Kelch repeat-containing protein n=1 Tax=Deinococcus sp. TaxID=47478 RepID=UPI003B5AB510